MKNGTPALAFVGTQEPPIKRRCLTTRSTSPQSSTTNALTTNALTLLTESEIETSRRRSYVRNCQKLKLTNEQRLYLITFLQQRQEEDGKIKRGSIPKAAKKFNVTRRTIYLLWNRYLKTCGKHGLGGDHKRHSTSSGRKRKHVVNAELLQRSKDIPKADKQTYRGYAEAIKIPKTTLIRLVKGKHLKHGFATSNLFFESQTS